MAQLEPPSSRFRSRAPVFFIGRDSRGNWVVQDEQRLCGGLFVDRAEAVRFALFENGNRPQAVIMVPGEFELDMSGRLFCISRRSTPMLLANDGRPKGLLSFPPNPIVVPFGGSTCPSPVSFPRLSGSWTP